MRQEWWVDYAVVGGASIFLLLGGFFLSIGIRNLWRAHSSEHWPKAAAMVSRSDASSSTSYNRKSRSSSTMYSADIEFVYQVAGQSYGTRIRHFGQTEGSGDSSEAEVLRYRYPPQAAVTVSYDPANPWIAAAEPGFDADALWLPGAGLAFAFPALMFIVIWFGMSRGNSRGFGLGLAMFASIFATIGFIMLAGGLTSLWRAVESTHWPRTKGVIVYGKVDQSRNAVDDSNGNTQSSVSSGTHIVYRYEVGGQTYFSNVRRFGQLAAGGDELAERIASRYPLHAEVPVAYSPGNPSLSTLETGLANEAWWLPGAGAAFFLFAMAVFIWGIPALTRDGF